MPGLTLSPEETAELEQIPAPVQPSGLNPIKDFSADELFELATKDSDNFHPILALRQNKDLWRDPAIVQKVADVQRRIKQRGFTSEDFPTVGEATKAVGGFVKGVGKQIWNAAEALVVNPAMAMVGDLAGQGPGFSTELEQLGQQRALESLTAMESSQFHTGRSVQKIFDKIVRKASAPSTPEERVKDLWDDVRLSEAEEAIKKGGSGYLIPKSMTSAVIKDLEAAGKPIREAEVEDLTPGDPIAFWEYGKIFQGVGVGLKKGAIKVAKQLPAKAVAVVEKVPALAEKTTERVAGRAIQAAGNLTELGGRAVRIAAPAVGMVKGAIEAGPLGALAGLKGGEIVSKIGSKISKGGKAIAESGKEIAGAAPVTGGVTQLAKDVIGGLPVAATEIGKGLAFDIGTAALTSESPQDTASVGIGAFFGALGAGKRVGQRVLSGQLVGPREWGITKFVPSSGLFHPAFEQIHTEVIQNNTPAVKARSNAIRQFMKGAVPGKDFFLLPNKPAAAEQALLQLGFSAERSKTYSQQEGFFSSEFPGKDGKSRGLILARNIDAAPHEAFHPIQDVLGEAANRAIDTIVREEYGPRWDVEGQRYADRIVSGGNWRETILDTTGTGLDYAKEKIAMDVGNEYRAATGAEPSSGFVQDRTKAILGQAMDRAVQANPNVKPNDIARHIWRDILSPEEATAAADSYMSRELAAENFDMVFKNLGAALNNQGLLGRLARIVAQLVSTLGGEPLSPERPSQIGQIAPRFRVTEAVRKAATELLVEPRPLAGKPEVLFPSTRPRPTTPSAESPVADPADDARKIAAEAPETSTVAGTASPREILGNVAEAIAQQAGLKVNYLSAPGEPAGAITSNRDARRAVIEWARTASPEVRAMWEKNFFPDRVVKLKGDKYQILGWAPEVFAANAHKLAAKLQELGVADASPYPVKDGTFTPEGWQELFKDVQTFVKNQMGGRTGAGESLVVPRDLTERGFFAPPVRGRAEALPQLKADFINMLFGLKIPDTARVQKGKIPLNLAGQVVSEATQPGRTEIPVIPRGRFEGAEAERQGIAGRDIKEVNPLRQQIEAAAQAKGVAMPEFIEAQQRLNLENIKDVQVAPELPQFRGNTLTLSAGFQPSSEPRAVRSAAVRDERGNVWEGFWHGDAEQNARVAGAEGPFADGFVTNDGEFLNRVQAFDRAEELNQIPKNFEGSLLARRLEALDFERLRSLETSQLPKDVRDAAVDKAAKFQPPKNAEQAEELVKSVAKMSPQEFDKWAHETPGGLTEAAHQTGLNAATQGFVNLLKAAGDLFAKKTMDLAATDVEAAMIVATQQQFFNEAWQAATGEGSAGYFLRKKDPNFQPKFPLDRPTVIEDTPVQMQPKKELKLKPAGRDGVSKAWVLPDGKVVNIGGQWHHEYLNDNPALRKQYKLSDDASQDNRLGALQKGFARLNWSFGSGHLTIEARTKDWPKQREAIRNFVEANADKIDRMQVVLMSDNLKKVDDSHEESVFMLEDNEKSAMLPFGGLDEKRETTDASDRLFRQAVEKSQLQPAIESELEKIRKGESSGQTFMSTGDVWTPGDKQVDIVTVASVNIPTKDLTAEKYAEAIAPYAELLEDPNVVAGVFSLGPETTSIDINAVVPQEHRENTKAFAKANDQMSIWDAVKFETVETGGTGETKLKSIPQIKAALSSLTQGEPVSVEDIAAQFQPRSAEKDLFGFEEKLSIREIAKLPPERLQEIYPEAIVPEDVNESIPSAIVESPLYEKSGSEDAAVKAFSDGLVKFAQTVRQDPVAKAGAEWYDKFTPELKKEFGKDAQLMAELLAATSPNTGVESNFKFALDALDSFKSGRFTKIMTKFNQGMDMVANDTWRSWYNKELKNIPEPPQKPTPATFLEHWIYKHDLKPRQSNGKLYGIHSLPVLQVFARKWLSAARGPKTLNFIENLMGQSHEATIDVWADRTMRRLGYAGEDRWRILPKNVRPVSDPDFEFAQKAFRHAANRLGMKPSALQGMLWFAEKKYWAEHGWADLNLGDFRTEFKKIPALRAKRLTLIEKSGKIPSKQLELK